MKAKDLLTDETKWCRGALARDAQGNECDPDSPEACRWCMLGAAIATKQLPVVGGRQYTKPLQQLMEDRVQDTLGGRFMTVGAWNDAPHRTLAEVHQLLEACGL